MFGIRTSDAYCMLFWLFILFTSGGYENRNYLDLAVKYDGSWEQIGSLMGPRYFHRSLVQGSKILHIGGYAVQIDGDEK